jgi:hypothetical protein
VRLRAAVLASLVLLASPASSSAAVSATGATTIASRQALVRQQLREHPNAYPAVSSASSGDWQVGYYSHGTEIAEVLVAKSTGAVLGAYAGFKIAWTMARGTPGAFGGAVDALYVWLPLSLLFVAPFFDFRRPARMINLDLIVLCAFSVSLAFFNHADIDLSVPLVYPPLLYLLARLLWVAWSSRDRPAALALNVPVRWLAFGAVVLVLLRIGVNVASSNVIDVGYANVVGAQKVASGQPLYGSFPASVANGDTYGPVSYEAYVPFVELFGDDARWNSVPAAHAAAIFFDLAAIALLFLLGRQIRGPSLGIVFAYAWAAFPFTAFALESNTNDALVAALILASLLLVNSPPGRGVLAALATLTKFAPLAMAPLLLTHRLREQRLRGLVLFALAFVLAALLAMTPVLAHNTLSAVYARTIGYQSGRRTPFSPWGLYGGLRGWQTVVQILAVGLAVAVAFVPRRGDLVALSACAGAAIIGVELGAGYWFYLYIPWFFGPAIVALFGGYEQLVDGVGAQRLRAGHQHTHQPRVPLGG